MGDHAALTALEWGITREAQDELAYRSHLNLKRVRPRLPERPDHAVPRPGEGPEPPPDTTLEKLAKLKTVYGKGETATMTAGNSTPLTDGASPYCWPPTSGRPSADCRPLAT